VRRTADVKAESFAARFRKELTPSAHNRDTCPWRDPTFARSIDICGAAEAAEEGAAGVT
jgi:hypothetical protein